MHGLTLYALAPSLMLVKDSLSTASASEFHPKTPQESSWLSGISLRTTENQLPKSELTGGHMWRGRRGDNDRRNGGCWAGGGAGTSQHEAGNEAWSQKAASVLGMKAPPRLVAGEGQI